MLAEECTADKTEAPADYSRIVLTCGLGIAKLCVGEWTAVRYVNITSTFPKLPLRVRRTFLRRFDNWIDGVPPNRRHYHGWNQSDYGGRYQECFVFKCQSHRLYGFLCHPMAENARFESCVLINHAFKRKWETDETELKHAREMSQTEVVATTVSNLFAA